MDDLLRSERVFKYKGLSRFKASYGWFKAGVGMIAEALNILIKGKLSVYVYEPKRRRKKK